MMLTLPTVFVIGCNLFAYASAIRLFGIHVILGDDLDEHGCKSSAGYYFCEHTDLCTPVAVNCLDTSNYTQSFEDPEAFSDFFD